MPPIYDPDNPYLQQQPPPVASPPPAPEPGIDTFAPAQPPPPTPAPPQTSADIFASIFEPLAPKPPPVAPPAPRSDYILSGNDPYFAPPAPSKPRYVTNDEYFNTPGLSQVGAGWVNDFDQQSRWFDAELTAAIQNGDEKKYNELVREWDLVRSLYNARGEGLLRQPDPFPTPIAYGTPVTTLSPDGTPVAGTEWKVRSDVQRMFEEEFGRAMRDYSLGAGMAAQRVEMGQPTPRKLTTGQILGSMPTEYQEQFLSAWDQYREAIASNQRYLADQRHVRTEMGDMRYAGMDIDELEYWNQRGAGAYGATSNPFLFLPKGAMQYLDFAIGQVTTGLESMLDHFNALPVLGKAIGETPEQPQLLDAEGKPIYVNRSGGIGDLIAQVNRIPGAALGLWSAKTGLTVGDYVFIKPGEFLAFNAVAGTVQTVRFLRDPLSGKSFNQQVREADWIVERFEQEHPWLYMAASLPFDPWNYVGVNLVTTPFKAARFRYLQKLPLETVLTERELELLRVLEPTVRDSMKMGKISSRIADRLAALGISDEISTAFAKRVGAVRYIDAAMMNNPMMVVTREKDALIDIARRMGASDTEIANLNAAIGRRQQQIARVLSEELDQNVVADVARAEDTVPPIGQQATPEAAAEARFNQIAQEAEDLSRAIEALPPRVEEPMLPQAPLQETPLGALPEQAAFPTEVAPARDPDLLRNAVAERRARTVVYNGRIVDPLSREAQQPYRWRYELPTDAQTYEIRKLIDKKLLNDDEVRRFTDGLMDRGEAFDIIRQRKGLLDPYENATRGYEVSLDPADPALPAQQQRAAAEGVARKQRVAQLRELLPKAGVGSPRARRQAGADAIKKALDNGPQPAFMSVAELLSALRVGLAQGTIPERLRPFVSEIVNLARHVNADGTLSSTTAEGDLRRLLANLYDALESPAVVPDIEDVEAFWDMMQKRIFSDTLVTQRLKKDAEDYLRALSPQQRAATLAETDALKQTLMDLRAQNPTGYLRDPRYAAGLNAIHRVDPTWEVPKPARKSAQQRIAERDAAQDAKIAAESGQALPPSPPLDAPLTPQVATDAARRDVLAQMERVPVEVVDAAPAQQATLAELDLLQRAEAAIHTTPDIAQGAWAAMKGGETKKVYPRHLMQELGVDRPTAERLLAELEQRGSVGRRDMTGGRIVRSQEPVATPSAEELPFITGPQLNLPPEVTGMLHWTESAGRRVLRARRTTRPIIEPGAFNWTRVDWRVHGGTFDRMMDDIFKFDNVVGKYSIKPNEAFALTQQAHVAMTSEVMGMFWRKHIDQIFRGWVKEEGRDPIAEMELLLTRLADDTLSLEQVAAIDPFFTSSKKGLEALRTFRRVDPESGKMIGQVLRDNWVQGKYNPYQSVGWLADMGVLPSARNGGYNGDDLETIFKYLTATRKPRGMDERGWQMLRSFQDAIGRDRIREVQRTLRPDPAGRWLTGDPQFATRVETATAELAEAQAAVDALPRNYVSTAMRQARVEGQAAVDNAFDLARAAREAHSAAVARMNAIRNNPAAKQAAREEVAALRAAKDEAYRQAQELKNALNARVQGAGDLARTELDAAYNRVRNAKETLRGARGDLQSTVRIGPESLDAMLFPESHLKPVDPYKMAEEMASDMAAMEGRRIGFNPDAIPMGMRTMQVVKGNLVPLWMTIYPGYHVRNIVGNITAQMLAAIRSDMHVGPNPFGPNRRILKKTNEAGSGLTASPWATRQGIGKMTGADTDPGEHLLPRMIRGQVQGGGLKQLANVTPLRLLNPLYVGGMWAGDVFERTAKTVVWSQEYGWTLADAWRKAVARLVPEGAQRDALLKAIGHNDLTVAMRQAGITDPALRAQLRSAMNGAIGQADWQAYRTTATTLRDYRMRNRMEGVLDKILPVHYWTTRNAYFVGSTIANKPGVALAAMQAYDNLVEQNRDLPMSQRGSLVKIPAEWVPFYDEDYHIRLTSLTNPAFFAAARLANPAKWDLSKTSLPHRLDGYAALGLRNMWEAMGYRIGPQWDLAIRAGNLANSVANRAGWDNHYVDRFLEGANWVNNPAGYRNAFLPFTTVVQTNTKVQQIMEDWNALVYQSPYTRAETANFMREAADRWQTGELTEVQYSAISQAIADRQFDYDPEYADKLKTEERARLKPGGEKTTDAEIDAALHMVRDIIDSVIGDRAGMWALNALGVGGAHFSEERLNLERQQRRYGLLRNLAKAAQFGIGLDNAAKLVALDMIGLKEADEKQKIYESILKSDGRYAALEWMRAEAPWLPGYWAAWDTPEEVAEARAARDDRMSRAREREIRGDIYAGYKADRETRAREREKNAPFYEQLDRIMQAYDTAMANANGNPGKMLAAEETKDRQIRELGTFPEGSGAVPREGREYYDWQARDAKQRAEDELLGQMDYPKELRDMQRDAAQRGYILDMVAEQLGLDQNDPKWKDDEGRFDRKAYEQAVADVADEAVLIYGELYREMVRADVGIEPGPLVSRVTKDDFIYHMRDKDAWAQDLYEARAKAVEEAKAMPSSTPEERAAKDAAFAAIEETYGKYYRKYGADERFTAEQNARYNEGARVVGDWYYTLTPREKNEFKAKYPEAFTSGKFVATDLHGDQIDEILAENHLDRVPDDSPVAQDHRRTPQMNAAIQAENERVARTERIYELREQFYEGAGLTPEQKAALAAVEAHDDKDPEMTERAFRLKDQLGLSWRDFEEYAKQSDIDLAAWIAERRRYTTAAAKAGAYDAQEAWFRTLNEYEQQLLITEDPSTFGRYGDASDGGGGTPAPQTGTSTSTDNNPRRTTYSGSGDSVPRWSGGYGGGSGGGRVPALSADWFIQMLNALGPRLTQQQRQLLLQMYQNLLLGRPIAANGGSVPPQEETERNKQRPAFPTAAG